jgi:hypothetical protein
MRLVEGDQHAGAALCSPPWPPEVANKRLKINEIHAVVTCSLR